MYSYHSRIHDERFVATVHCALECSPVLKLSGATLIVRTADALGQDADAEMADAVRRCWADYFSPF